MCSASPLRRRLAVIAAFAASAWGIVLGVGCLKSTTPLGMRGPSCSPSTICPFGLRGVRVATDDVPGGVDVLLTTYDTDVAQLRSRAHYALEGRLPPGESPPPGVKPIKREIPTAITVEDIAPGVLVHVRALDPKREGDVRDHVDAAIDRARTEACAE